MPKSGLIATIAGLLLGGGYCAPTAEAGDRFDAGAAFVVDYWGKDEGLPGGAVIAMIQTSDGYLWLGTQYGLVRFDGIRFDVYDESALPGLNSSAIACLFEDSRGNLCVGTENAGVVLIKPGGQVHPLKIWADTPRGKLVSATETADGAVWLYTSDGQLCRYREDRGDVWAVGANVWSNTRLVLADDTGALQIGTDTELRVVPSVTSMEPPNLPPPDILPIKVDFLLNSQHGGHWRLAGGRVEKWRGKVLERDLGAYPWTNTPVATACEDSQGNLIVGTRGSGVYWYNNENQAQRVSGLSHNTVLSLCLDREGSLWVGTDGRGLNRVKRTAFELIEDTRNVNVKTVCDDGEGGLLLGTHGGGVRHWKDGVQRQLGMEQGLTRLYLGSVFRDRDQRVWTGVFEIGLLQLQDGRFQQPPGMGARGWTVSAIFQDRAGQLWVGTQTGLWRWDGQSWKGYTLRQGLSSEVVRAIAEDAEGNLWVGTEGGGLNRLREEQIVVFGKGEPGLPSHNVSSLLVDVEGVLWIGTGGGLARFHTNSWAHYTRSSGLASHSIAYLIEDDQGFLWMGSNAGLMRASKQSLNDFARGATNLISVRTYKVADGLPDNECTPGAQPAACRTEDGRLWFPTIKGVVSVEPSRLKPNPLAPTVVLESVLADGQQCNTNGFRGKPLQAVTIPAGKEVIEIHYTSLNLAAADRARFKYRMEGHEAAWTDAGNVRFARYTKLPPKEYLFRVAACNEDGVWNEAGTALAVVVLPRFWQTWWFRSAVILGLLVTIAGVVYYVATQKLQRQLQQMRQQEALEKERSRIARDLHDQLGANLTQVALLGELAESDKDLPEEVETHARQISLTARDTTRALDEIVWAANPANDTLDSLITYACKYAQDYLALAGLRHRLEIPAQLPDMTIPPEVRHNVFLAFKEAVNNVVKHAQATEARIRLQLTPNRFTLEIADNGRGAVDLDSERARSRNGLRNMRKRMEDVHGEFSISPVPEGGTLVRLSAPTGNR
ncbi:MAG: ATP-binding protein [Verrucomicrobiae bacterium]|nr:ATP-binding protein [Verrucomicrobiae bacterium]